MATLTMIVTGFALALALVIALARTSTAPWEEARTFASAPPVVAARGPALRSTRTSPAGPAARIPAARLPAEHAERAPHG